MLLVVVVLVVVVPIHSFLSSLPITDNWKLAACAAEEKQLQISED